MAPPAPGDWQAFQVGPDSAEVQILGPGGPGVCVAPADGYFLRNRFDADPVWSVSGPYTCDTTPVFGVTPEFATVHFQIAWASVTTQISDWSDTKDVSPV